MPDIVLECRDVGHHYGARPILQNINLRIERGDIVALVGPSGSGKSTLLRAILGTHPPEEGEVLMNGVPFRTPSRHRGIVYQKYSLFPFLTSLGNVVYGPLLDRTTLPFRFFRPWRTARFRRGVARRARRILEKLKLAHAADQYPSQLSGGMQQRVAIAQALIMKPEILLLDEPFGALDEATREEQQIMLLRLYAESQDAKRRGLKPPYTLLIVTHELNEAIYVANRVIGLSQYHAHGAEGATIVYDKPATVFSPDEVPNFDQFRTQRDELRAAVFDPENLRHWSEFVTYWHDHGPHAHHAARDP
ncbi:MAG TPA: ATP-binding cassette domain-containing protein [Pirellulaceae bacterium]